MAVALPSAGPGRPPTKITVRVAKDVKDTLNAQAKAEGLNLSQYITKHFEELVSTGKVIAEQEVIIDNPGINPQGPYQSPYQNPQFGYQNPQHPYPPYPYGPPYYQPPPASPYAMQPLQPVGGPDQMDVMFADMRKMFMTKMMAEMIQGKKSIEDVYLAAQQNGMKKDDFSIGDMMKWQMMNQQMQAQQQQQMSNANLALEAARAKGDKQGEGKALEMIVALSTASAQQNQNFMSQFMTAMQLQQQSQQTLYTAALGSNHASEDAARQDRTAMQTQIMNMQNQMSQQQMASMQQVSTLQIESVKQQLEALRLNPPKDPLTSLIELDRLSKDSPVMQAAMKAVGMGGSSGGSILDLVPKLKELGIGNVATQLIGWLTGQQSGGARAPEVPPATPAIPAAQMPMSAMPGQAIPPPPAGTLPPGTMPAPAVLPSVEELGALHLVKTAAIEQGATQPVKGYSNLQEQEGTVPISIEAPKKELGYNNLSIPPPPTSEDQPQQGPQP